MRAGHRLRLVSAALALVGATLGGVAHADQPAPVDVVITPPPEVRRYVALEWNPLPLFTIGRLSANVVFAPTDHHALVLAPFYAWTTTAAIYIVADDGSATQLPVQHFEGGGAELGYRYYFGRGGPRGFFLGPSLILSAFQARAQDQVKTTYGDLGLAGDVGYQALVADRVSISLGAGLQYTFTAGGGGFNAIPAQQFPAELYANSGVRPRVLFAIGWAL
jgi:hypothetical protein